MSSFRFLGRPRPLLDGREKVSGRACYAGDLQLPRMLHARPVLSPHAHARITAIDGQAALAVPGVIAVLTERDLPICGRPMTSRPSAVLARDRVLFAGQPVALVVAESEAAAEDGAQLVRVGYEPLTPILDPVQAMADGAASVWPHGLESEHDVASTHGPGGPGEACAARAASNVHGHLATRRGDVETGLAESAVVVRRTYCTSRLHQAYLEPHAAVAEFDLVRRELTIHTATQAQFMVRDEVARAVGLPAGQVRVVPMTVGGGFGAKYGVIDPLVGAAAMVVGRPVRLVLTRSEDFLASTPAHSTVIDLELGVGGDGLLRALRARATIDNGAFPWPLASLCIALLGGYYRCPNVSIDAFDVLTTTTPAGAYRAPGAPQVTFALESAIDEAARRLGRDPLELRLANVAGGGDPMGSGGRWPSLGLRQCLERLREHPAWRERSTCPGEGVGVAIGAWPSQAGPASAVCRADGSGRVSVQVGSADISGAHGSLVLVAAEVLQISPGRIDLVQGDTRTGPWAGPAGGSYTTQSLTPAVRAAAEAVRRQLLELAAEHLEAGV